MFTEKSEHHTRHSIALQVGIPRQNVKIGVYTNHKISCVYVQFYYQGPNPFVFILYQIYKHLSFSLIMQQISQYSRLLYGDWKGQTQISGRKTRKLTNLQIFNYRGIVVYSLSVHSFSHPLSIKSKLLHCLLLCKIRSFVEQLPRRLVLEPRHMEKSGRGANFCGHGYLVSEWLQKVKH